jgi:esterase/lipase
MLKILWTLFGLFCLAAITYYLGPKPKFKPMRTEDVVIPNKVNALDSLVAAHEAMYKIRPNNEARIIWANKNKKKTEYSVVYLHGLSASHMEGDPVHREFAARYGYNLFLTRLVGHGIDSNAFIGMTPDSLYDSAVEAIEIGKKLGNKVILMSCSTGSTLSIMLAKKYPEIHSFIMYSPNIDIKDPMSYLITEQWGSELTTLVWGSDYNHIEYSPEAAKYWYASYHKDGAIATKRMIKDNMITENFKLITQPLFMGYYNKSDEEQDNVVSIPRMLEFYDEISTPDSLKRKVNFVNADGHVICSSLSNKDVETVKVETYKFAEEVLGLKPVGIGNNQ